MLGKLCCLKSSLCCNSHGTSQPRASGDSCVTALHSPDSSQSWLIPLFCPTDLPLTMVGSQTGSTSPFLPRGFSQPPTAHGSGLSRHSTCVLIAPGGLPYLSLPETGWVQIFWEGLVQTIHQAPLGDPAPCVCSHPHTSTPSPPVSPPRCSLLMDPVHKSEVSEKISEPKETAGRWREGGKRKRLFEY